jgi:hypothetical protein
MSERTQRGSLANGTSTSSLPVTPAAGCTITRSTASLTRTGLSYQPTSPWT